MYYENKDTVKLYRSPYLPMTQPSKASLREHARLHRERIDPFSEDFENAITLFCNHLQPQPGQVVALYWPKGREFDTRGLMEQLLRDGVVCALPVVVPGSKVMVFRRWREGEELAPGAFDIMQPTGGDIVRPDIVVVPLLAFDRRGHRLGYGGGYYDATLADLRAGGPVVAVGFAYAQQAVLFNLPAEEHDIPLDWVITPAKAHRFI